MNNENDNKNIIDDTENVDNALDYPTELDKAREDIHSNIRQAKEWSRASDIPIITPDIDNLEELENRWNEFMNTIKQNRRKSDWIHIELFGSTNEEMYNILKDRFSRYADIDQNNYQYSDTIEPTPTVSSTNESAAACDKEISYSISDINDAIEWCNKTGLAMIIPTDSLTTLEQMWDKYNSMTDQDKEKSDNNSKIFFGVCNKAHYIMLKKNLNADIKFTDDEDITLDTRPVIESFLSTKADKRYLKNVVAIQPISEVAKALLKQAIPKKNIYEETLVNNVISDVVGDFESISNNDPEFIYSDYPFITPEDMISMGVYNDDPENNYYKALADNTSINKELSSSDWFEEYKIDSIAYSESFRDTLPEWVDKVRGLCYGLKQMQKNEAYTAEDINARKQSILELGWNPEIEFTDKARSIARECAKMRRSSVNIVNLTEFDVNFREPTEEDLKDKNLYPVYIVLVAGATFHSKMIMKFTHDPYSHAAFSLDHTLHECYTFKALDGEIKIKNSGFHREGLEDIFQNRNLNIGVFCFFVSKVVYNKLLDVIKHLDANAEKSRYSFFSLLCYILHLPVNIDYRYFCSQFVDVVLRKADINITNKGSSTFVSPGTLHKAAMRNEKIFKLFEGPATEYDPDKILAVVNALSKTAKPLKESENMYLTNESMYVNYVMQNANKIDTLLSLKEYSNIVTNPTIKSILDKVLFESISLDTNNTYNEKDELDYFIKKYCKPLC